MKKILILAVYTKEQSNSQPFVGIFWDSLDSPPVESFALDEKRDDYVVEFNVAGRLYELQQEARRHVTILFSEEQRVYSNKMVGKKFFFIKPGHFFSYDVVLKKIKI